MIECMTPGHAASNVSIFTSTNNQNFIDSGFTYTFHDDLLVHAIVPTFGSTKGGTMVTLSGANFIDSGSLKCKFGSAEPSFAYYESSSSIMCVTPPIYNMVKVSVYISLNGKDFIRTPIVFTFTAAPNISSINPTMIKEMEESIITVYGSNFIDVNTIVCRFGTKIAKGIWLSNSEIQCRSPKMSPGNTKFDISLNSKDYTSAHFSINVIENFHINSVLPSRGSIHGGTKIFLQGTASQTLVIFIVCLNFQLTIFVLGPSLYRAKSVVYNT